MDEIILVDKPAGMSSFAVVARVRRILTEKAREEAKKKGQTPPKRVKVGHTGTLDPFATGLLILLAGKATKRSGEFLKLDKKYEAVIELGKTSSTGDVEGVITDSFCVSPARQKTSYAGKRQEYTFSGSQVKSLDPQKELFITPCLSKNIILNTLQRFVGEIEQRVPEYSAVKINGQRAYKLAREGKKIKMPVRKVQIYDIELLEYQWPKLKIRCHVSSGTYIRTLGEDIGKALGVGGYLTELRRIEVGKYDVKDAKTLAELGITS